MLPSVSITKQDFSTGSVAPQPDGILAILAGSSSGTANQPASYFRDDLVATDFGVGPIVEYASYQLQIAGNPILACKTATSVGASIGSITSSITGTATATNNSSSPLDEYDVVVTIVTGGTVGVAGITYTYSLDGGDSQSGVLRLGTSSTLTIPNSGVSFSLGAGTFNAADTWQVFASRAQPNDSDLVAALAALKVSRQPWEAALIDCTYGTGTIGMLDTWVQGLERMGQFKLVFLNTRHKLQPVPTQETEAAYATYISNLVANDSSIRLSVGVDAADCTSTLTGWTQPRPVAMFLAARAMSIPIGEDPAFVGRGPIPNAKITDGQGNPRWHDEELYPGLDAQRVACLRSFSPGGPTGTYICNANLFSPSGSDYAWVQHARVMNKACTIAWQVLSTQLSRGVQVKPKDQQTGAVYIREDEAQRIDGLVNGALAQPLKGQVSAYKFALSRTDDLSSNTSSTATGTVKIVSLRYLKDFKITTSFEKSISVPTTPGA